MTGRFGLTHMVWSGRGHLGRWVRCPRLGRAGDAFHPFGQPFPLSGALLGSFRATLEESPVPLPGAGEV